MTSRHIVRVQLHTIGNMSVPVCVVAAATTVDIQQPTGHISQIEHPSVLIFQFVQTTPATAITQGFPFIAIKFGEGFNLPKRFIIEAMSVGHGG